MTAPDNVEPLACKELHACLLHPYDMSSFADLSTPFSFRLHQASRPPARPPSIPNPGQSRSDYIHYRRLGMTITVQKRNSCHRHPASPGLQTSDIPTLVRRNHCMAAPACTGTSLEVRSLQNTLVRSQLSNRHFSVEITVPMEAAYIICPTMWYR